MRLASGDASDRGDPLQKYWRWLGLNLGKHWIVVLVVGAVATLAIGFGATKLQFSTSQNSYLNTSDQVYKDNVKYQGLFGGEAMVVLVTMDPGHTVSELFTPADVAQWQRFAAQLHRSGKIDNVVTPLTRAGVQRRARVEPDRRPDQERRRPDPPRHDSP